MIAPHDETAPQNPAAFGGALRDWFAGQALSGLPLSPSGSSEVVARAAYMIADAMLRERSK